MKTGNALAGNNIALNAHNFSLPFSKKKFPIQFKPSVKSIYDMNVEFILVHVMHFGQKCSANSISFLFSPVSFRHVCHYVQNKTQPKAINYISDAGGIYHDIILIVFAIGTKKKDERNGEKMCIDVVQNAHHYL